MNYFTVHPEVYNTFDKYKALPDLLQNMWEESDADTKFVIISGFANYNGGVRFYDLFEEHIENGGSVTAILGGSTSQHLSTIQVVRELVSRGVNVVLVNRKRLLHAKLYGSFNNATQSLITSSGNFTGPGMMMNVEASVSLDNTTLEEMNFSWENLLANISEQNWQMFEISGTYDETQPYAKLLYDEEHGSKNQTIDEVGDVEYLVTTLTHNDTSRIVQKKIGTQYIWLSKDTMGYFPPLLIRNKRGSKKTYSAEIRISYPQLNIFDVKSRVTFEAENNLDFRFGTTSKVHGTQVAGAGDLAVIKRNSDNQYDVIFVKTTDTQLFTALNAYAVSYIGHAGKRYGFIPADEFEKIMPSLE